MLGWSGICRWPGHCELNIDGAAKFEDDEWDFDWQWKALLKEQEIKLKTHRPDLSGRETRTALGSAIPGKKFAVRLKDPVKVVEKSGDTFATFSK